jgi:site-specific DNA-methyltransferase (adenine-specific)
VQLILGDCLKVLPTLAAGSVDAVVTDPPYGCGLDVWDRLPDHDAVVRESLRSGAQYFAVFGTFTSLLGWHASAVNRRLVLREHIVWVKRMVLPGPRLSRGHESILVFSLPRRGKLYQTRGPYEDVKVPGILFDTVTIQTIQCHIAALKRQVRTGIVGVIKASTKSQEVYSRYKVNHALRFRSDPNFTNVWSFLPPGRANTYKTEYSHPTEKPTAVIERCIEMTTPPGATVLDPFMGSGTTGVACVRTGRNFIGIEIDPTYFAIAERRIAEAQAQLALPMEAA